MFLVNLPSFQYLLSTIFLPSLLNALAVTNLKEAVNCTGTGERTCRLGFELQHHDRQARQFSSLSHITIVPLTDPPMHLLLWINDGTSSPQHSALHNHQVPFLLPLKCHAQNQGFTCDLLSTDLKKGWGL